MNNIFYFAFVGIIVVVSLYIILKILIKKFYYYICLEKNRKI